MKFQIPAGVSRAATRAVMKSRKHAPVLLLAGGVAGTVASTVLACKATLQVEPVLDELEERKRKIETGRKLQLEKYTERDAMQDTRVAHVQAAVKLAKLYAPAVIVGTISVAMLIKSHNIQQQRIVGLTAAYTATKEAMDRYRSRVREELGDEKDLEFLYGKHEAEIEVEDKNGPKKKKVLKPGDGRAAGDYRYLFDEHTAKTWSNIPSYNVTFLRGHQDYANDRLRLKGHLFLNDVLEAIGLPHTPQGAVTGWIYKGEHAKDGFVDFGIFNDPSKSALYEFCTGEEGAVWLDFNVDGSIWDKI